MSPKHEWLGLLEVSGPFLAVPVLDEVFPQGLEALDTARARRLRSAYEEWRDAVDTQDAERDALHAAWVDEVLHTALEADDTMFCKGGTLPAAATVSLPEHGTTLTPDVAFVDPSHGGALLAIVHVFPPDTDLAASMKFAGLACTPGDRMALHLRALNLAFGLVTNGERWMLVHAPTGQVATFASWYARLWSQEPDTLRAFVSLLGVRRMFFEEKDRLSQLFQRSSKHQDEVTEALGEQVRRAIEVLVQALDRADQDRNRELLRDVKPRDLYEAGLTVMMRLVFLLAAEERGLLLLGEPRYDAFYAVSTLRMQLRAESDEILERRRSAWSRLLATFRAVFGGIEHPTLRLPAMGGSLFDPDRFPFLEGRTKGTSWRRDPAEPLPIDDRTVLLLLDAIQTFEGRPLSYRALDVEQIGHVYEGLLERTVTRVDEVTLELEASANAKDARVTLPELHSARLDGRDAVVSLLVERSKRSHSAIGKALDADVSAPLGARLLSACRGDVDLRNKVAPYAKLLRTDPWGYPLVHPKGAFVVVLGADRRETGTHYTPKSLTERIVEETLTPQVYDGPSKGTPKAEWILKSPAELLDLKICDPAMGSGAFLVQACRFLGARLVEAWSIAEASGKVIDILGQVQDTTYRDELMPPGDELRAEHARRLVAERCLYGVDLNPLAVELAKLSLWLVTLSKGRPFGFLDHSLRCGDSLLGISRLEQLTELRLDPTGPRQGRLFGKAIEGAVNEAIALRRKLREIPIRDIHDVEVMAALDAQARRKVEAADLLADAFIGMVFAADGVEVETRVAILAADADRVISGEEQATETMARHAAKDLAKESPSGGVRHPLHWPLEFPDVFQGDMSGFDAIIGNPPFIGGRKIRGALGGAYLRYLMSHFGKDASGNADLCAFFFLRAFALAGVTSSCGFLATNTIAEGDTRRTGLGYLLSNGARIYHAEDDFPWPGAASVTIAVVVFSKVATRVPAVLAGAEVERITASLKTDEVAELLHRLRANQGLCYQGTVLAAKGFILTPAAADALIQADPKNSEVIMPYFTGEELFNSAVLEVRRYVINFHDWPIDKAKMYERPFMLVKELVLPVRNLVNRRAHRDFWWHFGDKRPALYSLLAKLDHALVQTRHTKYLCPQFVATGAVFSESTVVFPTDEVWFYGLLNSQIHEAWARETSGSIGTGLRYTPTDCLETFALPDPERLADLQDAAEEMLRTRDVFRQQFRLSVNEMMDALHDVSAFGSDSNSLRDSQRRMDEAVARAYGWPDLDLAHAFRAIPTLPASDRIRYCVSESARAELIKRLTDLNLERHAQDAASGAKPGSSEGRAKKTAPAGQGGLALIDAAEAEPKTSKAKTDTPAKKTSTRRTRR